MLLNDKQFGRHRARGHHDGREPAVGSDQIATFLADGTPRGRPGSAPDRVDTGPMPVEETMWDVRVTRDIETYDLERLRAAFADIIAKRLAPGKRLLRVVTWCQDGGSLFRTKPGARRYAVAYEVVFTA